VNDDEAGAAMVLASPVRVLLLIRSGDADPG
jgi:hypothetical protein